MGKKKSNVVSLAAVRSLPPMGPERAAELNMPTPERAAKLGVTMLQGCGRAVQFVGGEGAIQVGADAVARVVDDPFAQLAARGRLDDDTDRNRQLKEAGDKLRSHWWHAGLGAGPGAVDLNRAGGGNGNPVWAMPTTERAAFHRERFRDARAEISRDWGVVFAVVCGEATLESAGRDAGYGNKDAARAVALDRLRRGLEVLAVLWGISPAPRPSNDNALAFSDAQAA